MIIIWCHYSLASSVYTIRIRVECNVENVHVTPTFDRFEQSVAAVLKQDVQVTASFSGRYVEAVSSSAGVNLQA